MWQDLYSATGCETCVFYFDEYGDPFSSTCHCPDLTRHCPLGFESQQFAQNDSCYRAQQFRDPA